jgi:hypothetical protein
MPVDRVQPASLHTGEWVRFFLKFVSVSCIFFETAYLVYPSSRRVCVFPSKSPPPPSCPYWAGVRQREAAVVFAHIVGYPPRA